MPIQHRWTFVGLLGAAGLGLAAAAWLVLGRDPGWLTYTLPPGQAQNELTLRVSGQHLELLDGATGVVLQSRPLGGTRGVSIQGGPGQGDDSLTVDLSGGAMPLPDGIHFDASAGGYNTLVVTGGEAGPGSYQATGPGAGIVTHGDTQVSFSNLAPVTDTVPLTDFTINIPAGTDVISITNGAGCGAGCQTTKVSSPAFESIAFAHKTNVTINGGAGADAFNLNNSSPATGLNKLVIQAAGNPTDTVGITDFNLPGGTLALSNVVTVSQSGLLTVGSLAMHAAGTVNLGNISNQVTTVADNTTTNGASFVFRSSVPTLTVGSVAGIVGVTTVNGAALLENTQTGGALVVSSPVATAGGGLDLFADHMTFNAALNAGAGTAYLDNETFSEPIALGTKPANMLGLIQSDLSQVTAGALRVGDAGADTGSLTVTASLAAPAGWSTLDLRQATDINESFSAIVTVPNLAFQTHGGSVNFGLTPNRVGTLAGATQGGAFDFTVRGHTTISTVVGVSGLNTAGGSIAISSNKDGLRVGKAMLAGAGSIFLSASESANPDDSITVDPGVVVSSTASDINLWAADRVDLGAGSLVAAGGAGNVTILFNLSDNDGQGGATIAGTVAGTFPKVLGGDADGTLLVDFTAGAALPKGLSYDGEFGLKGLTMSDAGSAGPHQYVGSGVGLSRDFANLVQCVNVEVMTVIGSNGGDTFEIEANAVATYHVIGGLPGGAPGDNLFMIDIGATNPTLTTTSFDATGLSGQWTFDNRVPIYFTGIDTFGNLTNQLQLPLLRK